MSAPPPSVPRLVYLANVRLPSEKAHVFQIVKTCEAFARGGLAVELWHPGRRSDTWSGSDVDCFEYYGLARCFTLRVARVPDLIGLGLPGPLEHLAFLSHSSLFAIAALRHGIAGLLYTRDLVVATLLAIRRRPFILELHTLPEAPTSSAWLRFVSRRAVGVVVISQNLADDCVRAGVSPEGLLVARDGVDRRLAQADPLDPSLARSRLGLAKGASVACYTGHLYGWKGIDTLLECARRLPDVLFLIVGGLPEDVRRVKERALALGIENVRLEGHVPPSRVPEYLAAADVLVLPNSARTALSSRHTSPLKAFEYMAAGKAIVASDLPSIREIFEDGKDAALVPPDDGRALAAAIGRLLADPDGRRALAEEAKTKAERHTWEERAAAIIEFATRRGGLTPLGPSPEPCPETS